MTKIKIIWVTLMGVFLMLNYAQAQESNNQGLNCFDYYHFQSVQVSVGTDKNEYIPQEYVVFSGDIENENDYPVVDGNVFARISKKNPDYRDQGNFVIQEFFPSENISLLAKEKKPIKFEWQIPQGVAAGDYRADFFFSVGKKFNLGGLPFSNEVVVGTVNFKLTKGADGVISFDRSKTLTNGEKYNHVGNWPKFDPGMKAEIIQPLSNPSSSKKNVSVKYELYYWDSLNEEDRISSKMENIDIDPGKTVDLKYEIPSLDDSVYYLKISAVYKTEKAIVNIRLLTSREHLRLNYPAITMFPLTKGDTATVFSCFHNSSDLQTKGKVDIVLKDRSGNQVTHLEYQGDITEKMMATKKDFVVNNDYDYLTMIAKMTDASGKVVDHYETVYDCNTLKSDKCNRIEATNKAGVQKISEKSGFPFLIIIFFIVVILIFSVIIFVIKKRKESSIKIILFIILAGASLFCLANDSSAYNDKTATVSRNFSFYHNLHDGSFQCYDDDGNLDADYLEDYVTSTSWAEFNGTASVVQRVGMTSGGNNVSVGEDINFAYNPDDPFFNSTGGSYDTPYGAWCPNSSNMCGGSWLLIAIANLGLGPWIYENYTAIKPINVEITSNNPSVVSCSGMNCLATGPGTARLTASVPAVAGVVWEKVHYLSVGFLFGLPSVPAHDCIARDSVNLPATSFSWDINVTGTSFALNIDKTGDGTGTVTTSPAGISCGTDCSGVYPQNSLVTLTAIADAGSIFSGWSSNCTPIDATRCQVVMNSDKTVTAIFLTAAAPPVIGVCGSASSGSFSTQPVTDLCSAGTPSSVSFSGGNWIWTCYGDISSNNADCQAGVIGSNGVCGAADGGSFPIAPTTDLCITGTSSSVSLVGSTWTWSCNGTGIGFTDDSCSANLCALDVNCSSHPKIFGPCTAVSCGTSGTRSVTCDNGCGGTTTLLPQACMAPGCNNGIREVLP